MPENELISIKLCIRGFSVSGKRNLAACAVNFKSEFFLSHKIQLDIKVFNLVAEFI